MWQSANILKVFNSLTLKRIFWKTKTLFKKLEHCFFVESTKIENASFSYKTAISEAVKTNHMLRQIKWWPQNGSITKNLVLPVTNLFFWKFCFSLKTSYKELICCTNNPYAHICTFCKPWGFIWRCPFSLWVSLKILLSWEIQKTCNFSLSNEDLIRLKYI